MGASGRPCGEISGGPVTSGGGRPNLPQPLFPLSFLNKLCSVPSLVVRSKMPSTVGFSVPTVQDPGCAQETQRVEGTDITS